MDLLRHLAVEGTVEEWVGCILLDTIIQSAADQAVKLLPEAVRVNHVTSGAGWRDSTRVPLNRISPDVLLTQLKRTVMTELFSKDCLKRSETVSSQSKFFHSSIDLQHKFDLQVGPLLKVNSRNIFIK